MKLIRKRWESFIHACKHHLAQGLSVEKVALTIAIGFIFGIIPLPGTTIVLCVIAAFVFRLNHLLIQSVNMLFYPLQLILLYPFYKFGNKWFEAYPVNLPDFNSVKFSLGNLWGIIEKSAGNALLLWVLTALPISISLYYISRRMLRLYAIQTSGKDSPQL